MKFERNRNSKKYFLCGLILVVVLTVTITFIGSKANYRMTASIPLTEGKITASPYDFKLISMYLNNGDGSYIEDKTNTIPSGDYTINSEKSYCYKTNKDTKDGGSVYTDELGNHVIKDTSKGSKCILFFDKNTEVAKTMNELLNTHYKYKSKRTVENKDFNIPYEETTYGMIFEAEDDDGISYYFAGNPLDNWVEFGGYYWRIIRVNGNGSIRLIYQGKAKDENGNKLEPPTTGEKTQIGTSLFNEKYDDNAYVGFMYGTPNSTTHEATHENKNDSVIKQALDNWFINSNIKQGTNYFNKLDINVGFCGDRASSSSTIEIDNKGGIKMVRTYYGSITRIYGGDGIDYPKNDIHPSFKCDNISDLYTYNKSSKGNKKLSNPVGLITVDEVSYAGAKHEMNIASQTYLKTGSYWTMSPYQFNSDYKSAVMYVVWSSGRIGTSELKNSSLGVRPVINLRSDVTFTGDGTKSNPFKVI
ncbi:MAG: hypothetical protein NC483_04520 [Ruminococcus sp.]|nr:hypothetical protein [Ruminococcus sp.]